MKRTADPMAVLPPVPIEIRVAEQTLALTPLVLGELPAFAKAIQPFTADLAIEPDWLRLLGSHGDAMIEAMARPSFSARATRRISTSPDHTMSASVSRM